MCLKKNVYDKIKMVQRGMLRLRLHRHRQLSTVTVDQYKFLTKHHMTVCVIDY